MNGKAHVATGTGRVVVGVLGGLAAVCVKFLGQDYAIVVTQYETLSPEQVTGYIVGYAVISPILLFLGGLLAWASNETHRMKLLAIGIAAPALITTWAGGIKTEESAQVSALLVRSAYAAEEPKPVDEDPTAFQALKYGVGTFFGFNREARRYWIVAGSHKDREAARKQVDQINQETTELNAFVGIKGKTGYYPVIVGQGTYAEAKAIKNKAIILRSVDDAYLSNF